MLKKIIIEIRDDFKISTWIYLVVFSLVAIKSIMINPFNKIPGFPGILIGIIALIMAFVISALIVHFVSKIGWKQKKTIVKKYRILLYMIPGIAVSTLLWLCNWPAIVPADSADIWHMIS